MASKKTASAKSKFIVRLRAITNMNIEVEARSEDEAWEIATAIDRAKWNQHETEEEYDGVTQITKVCSCGAMIEWDDLNEVWDSHNCHTVAAEKSSVATTAALIQEPFLPLRVIRSVNTDVYSGEDHLAILAMKPEDVDAAGGGPGKIIADIETGPDAERYANLFGAAPHGCELALSMRNACEEHLSTLNQEMSHGREGADEKELDDLQDQIDNWYVLLNKCNAFLAKAYGKAA